MSSALFLYMLLHSIDDIQEKMSWYEPIKLAGTATLTCYLIPYFFNSFRTLLGIQLPLFLTTGLLGLLKSIVYSFIIIMIFNRKTAFILDQNYLMARNERSQIKTCSYIYQFCHTSFSSFLNKSLA